MTEPHQETGHSLLYDGVLLVLEELYGPVEGRILLSGESRRQRYYIIHQPTGGFILRECDITALVQTARASLPSAAQQKGGGPWRELPERYGHPRCVADRLRLWQRTGVWGPVWEKLPELGAVEPEMSPDRGPKAPFR